MSKFRKFHFTPNELRKYSCEQCPHYRRRFKYPGSDSIYIKWCKKNDCEINGWGCKGENLL